jgi:hypothetical protein
VQPATLQSDDPKVQAIKDVVLDYMNVSTDQLASVLEKS